ncbi:barstar family protein [Nibribacter koreensis]|uniref:Barstar family protein n=1 Tax=Nibribacter koreensis TaxID=1084519 RepID=A0ABP8FS09_9BACT
MKSFYLKGENIADWDSFHKEIKHVLGFPDYYGENMNAWIDCVDEMSEEEPILIQIENCKLLKTRAPEILEALFECTAFVNYRKLEVGSKPTLILSAFISSIN